MEERRAFPRIPMLYDVVEIYFPDITVRVHASAINLSHGGLGLHAPQRLPVGSAVVVRFGFWDLRGLLNFETVSGVLRWTRPKGPGYIAGIRFDGLTREEHPRILALLEEADHAVAVGPPQAPPPDGRFDAPGASDEA